MDRDSPGGIREGVKTRLAAVLAVVAALLAWLWPIGIGGKMPVGGDVTQFFLGLMGFLTDSLRAGQLPVWNDLWGYGFPGLAESQMGVYYPPHVLLYGRLDTETAYVVSLVLHTLWGGLGTFWAARRMGISAVGSALAAFSWSSCGFFLIHLAHPWGYTTGGWMPWAWGLAWSILAPGSRIGRARPFLLSLVLVLQVLPGHFQVAFQTQVALGLMVVWTLLETSIGWSGAWPSRWARRRGSGGAAPGAAPIRRRVGCVVVPLVAVFPLAALQLWPTARLAELAGNQRDFEYLSGFAATPFHLVNYAAPGLFHRSELWRPLVWDPFHTSPEEQLTYVGLVPLFLAVASLVHGFRRDPAIRLLTILALVTLLLSLGPYLPGFRTLILVPGFSFFRCPSRWSLATALALALLAGKGFDGCREWAGLGRAVRWFVILMTLWVVVVLGLIELAVWSTAPPGKPEVVPWFDRVFRALPWADERRSPMNDPSWKDPNFEAVLAKARQPVPDRRVPAGLALAHVLQKAVNDRVFTEQRWRIYSAELWETAVLLVVLWVVGGRWAAGRARAVRWALVLIAFLDLFVLGRHRLLDVGPLRPLVSQSPVLARLAREPRGTRTADPLKNMPMLVGLAPISSYRTLTLPAVEGLTAAAQGLMSGREFEALATAALRATGTSLRIFPPVENQINRVLLRAEHADETIEDPALASWLYGASWTAGLGSWVRKFTIWRSPKPPARAWLLPLTAIPDPIILDEGSGDPRQLLPLFERAEPLPVDCSKPGEWTIWLDAFEPACAIVSQLADPQWTARWIGQEGQGEWPAPILPTFNRMGEPGGWQRVEVPGEGLWMLHLEYQPRDAAEGLAISTIAWTSWLLAALHSLWRSRVGRPRTSPADQTGA